ncbi:Tyrosinase [Dactylellina cionopaga]|nr:Tyrosinase [Dactylellina cionopaga]
MVSIPKLWALWGQLLHLLTIPYSAIWQAANPTMKFKPDQAAPTFQRIPKAGENDTMTTPLYPFKHENGAWWTSQDVSDVRNIWTYGSGFPEVPCDRKGNTVTQLDDFTTSRINALYKTVVKGNKLRRATLTGAESHDVNSGSLRRRQSTTAVGRVLARDDPAGKTVLGWNINAVIDHSELSGSFSIIFFLGQPPADPEEWNLCKQKIGSLAVLGMPGMKKQSKIVAATIPITQALKDVVNTEVESEVTDYLSKNLFWKCLQVTSPI